MTEDLVVIVEVKLAFRPDAMRKLDRFYAPLVKRLYPKHTIRQVQVCKNLPLDFRWELSQIEDLLALRPEPAVVTWR